MHTLARSLARGMSQRRIDTKTLSLFFQLAIETAANEQGYPISPVAKRPGPDRQTESLSAWACVLVCFKRRRRAEPERACFLFAFYNPFTSGRAVASAEFASPCFFFLHCLAVVSALCVPLVRFPALRLRSAQFAAGQTERKYQDGKVTC